MTTVLTHHARQRMADRAIDEQLLAALIERGELLEMGPGQLLIYGHIPGRSDNLLCVAVAREARLVVKTVMVNWSLRRQQ